MANGREVIPLRRGEPRFRSRKHRCPQQNQTRKRIRLDLETLEERLVPSGTAVTSGQDLLDALKPGGNVSVSVKRDFTLIDSPKTPAVEITSGTNLTVNGSGYTLTAAAASLLFQVDKGASLTLVDVTLIGGAVTSTTGGTGIALGGGAILAQGGGVAGTGGSGAAGTTGTAGGPIYYPLLPGVKSIGGGDTTATVGGGATILGTVAAVEGTTTAKNTDEIGQPRTAKGAIDIGAIQTQPPPPSPPPSPPGGCTCATSAAATANQMLQNLNAYVLKIDLQMYESGLQTLDSTWTQLTGKPPLSDGPQDALYLQVVFAYYRLFTSFLPLSPLSEEPATTPEQSGATGAEESFAASTPVVIGD